MIRLCLRALAALALIFSVTISAILAQPRDDAAIRAFFSPPQGCSSPCFLGIRPGVTTHDQAVALLSTQPWINIVQSDANALSWTWNGKQPAFVSDFPSNFLLARIDFQGGVVSAISVPTTTRWADFYFLFGSPDQASIITSSAPSVHYRVYDAAYFAPGFEVQTTLRCPVTSREAAWSSTVFITWPISRLSHPQVINDGSSLGGC